MRLDNFDLNLLVAFDVLLEERSVTREEGEKFALSQIYSLLRPGDALSGLPRKAGNSTSRGDHGRFVKVRNPDFAATAASHPVLRAAQREPPRERREQAVHIGVVAGPAPVVSG